MTTWVLLAGPPATGKSVLATALERRLRAVTLSKDRVRSVLFPGSMTDYTGEQDDLCMRAMVEAAAYLTARDRVDFILFDGRTFSRAQQIGEVIVAAERAGAAWKILQLSCADEVVAERLSRDDPNHPARNRDMALYRKVKQDFELILQPKLELDTTGGIEGKLDRVQAYLTRSAP
jgi:adenylylsulfate kinase